MAEALTGADSPPILTLKPDEPFKSSIGERIGVCPSLELAPVQQSVSVILEHKHTRIFIPAVCD